jgi:hypothetical protein
MGGVVEELNSSGQKTAGYVYGPGGELLATQTSDSGTNVVTWKHLTSFGIAEYSINTANSTVGRVEFDPLHADVSTTAPPNPPLIEGQGEVSPNNSGSNLSARFGDIFNTTAGCMIDGIPSTCDMAMSLRNRGAGDRVMKALVYNRDARGIDWYGDVHEEGVAGFSFLEFRNATGGRTDAGYAPDTYSEVRGGTRDSIVNIFGGAALASTTVGAEPTYLQPQNSGELRVMEEAQSRVTANYDKCRKRVFGNAQTFADRNIIGTQESVLALFAGGLGTDRTAMVAGIWGHESNFVQTPDGDAGPAQLTSWWRRNQPQLIVGNAYGTWRGRTNGVPFDGDVKDNLATLGNIVRFSRNRYGNDRDIPYWYGPGDPNNPVNARKNRNEYANHVMQLYGAYQTFFDCLRNP